MRTIAEIYSSTPKKIETFFPYYCGKEMYSYEFDDAGFPKVLLSRDRDIDDILQWCEEHFANSWLWAMRIGYWIFYFKNPEDAILFKLTFSS